VSSITGCIHRSGEKHVGVEPDEREAFRLAQIICHEFRRKTWNCVLNHRFQYGVSSRMRTNQNYQWRHQKKGNRPTPQY
jgi:hypothetical protein